VPTLTNNLRAPAETPTMGVFSVLAHAAVWLLTPFIRCRHLSAGFPINDHQTCLDCGATRLYLFNTDFENGRAGIRKGPWRKATCHQQSAHAVARQSELNGRDLILNPGAESDLFKPRPRAARTSLERVTETTTRIMDRHAAESAVQL